jgi:hypothetical protein
MAFAFSLVFLATSIIFPAYSAPSSYAQFLDSFNIYQKWIRGKDCDIYTGEHHNQPHSFSNVTYCSLFVAHIARHLNIYLPAPPFYKRYFLATRQCRWLFEQGKMRGWKKVSFIQAQDYANEGYFTLACSLNDQPNKPGHIAVVRPAFKLPFKLLIEGPQILNVGWYNNSSISAKEGFKKQKDPFKRDKSIYYFTYLKELKNYLK